MDGRNYVVDVSSFFLFEATGDSEADSDINLGKVDMDVGDHDDDDDAQSCSWDSSDCVPIMEFDGSDDHDDDDLGFVKINGYDGCEQEEDDEDEDEDEVNKQDWFGDDKVLPTSGAGLVKSGPHKRSRSRSRVCVDSAREVMNEMEKNKLFWEACLAS